MEEVEIWKPIQGFEKLYDISSLGRIRSCDKIIKKKDGKKYHYKGKILKPYITNQGHLVIILRHNNVYKHKLIHRLVAEAFIPNPNNKPEIDHINTIRTDNRCSNLRWCTRKENSNNPLTIEKYKKCKLGKQRPQDVMNKIIATRERMGYKNIMAPKPVIQFTKNLLYIKEYSSIKEAASILNLKSQNISSACKDIKRSCGGFRWKFKNNQAAI